MSLTKPIRIPFHMCDPAKIMFFGALYPLYHMFLEEHIEALGVSWKDWFQGETGSPIRGLTTDYRRPIAYGTTYVARLKVTKVGTSSVTFVFSIETEGGITCVETAITHCLVINKTRQKAEVPKHIKEALLKRLEA